MHSKADTQTRAFNGPFSGSTLVGWYQKGNTNLDFTDERDSEWQWHQLGHMQVCTSLQTDNHASTSPLNFLQAGCPSCCPTNGIKVLKAVVSLIYCTEPTIKKCITEKLKLTAKDKRVFEKSNTVNVYIPIDETECFLMMIQLPD